jgi:dTDP-4-amino-4,6-dideoxygalactose transaminase
MATHPLAIEAIGGGGGPGAKIDRAPASPPTPFAIPFARPSLEREEEEAVLRVMRSGWLTTGVEALAFEREFAARINSPHALAVSSATAALHLALLACGVGPGDLVLTTAYTFVATAHAVRHAGAEPVFVDIDPATLNLDPIAVERACREIGTRAWGEAGQRAAGRQPAPRVAAVLPVHIAGLPCDMSALRALCDHYRLPLIEDAAHAFPVPTEAGFAGTIGDCGAFSFYANKTITTGEGGMLVTRHPDVARKASRLRLHGIDRPLWQREASAPSGRSPGHIGRTGDYDVVALGFKYNMPDLAAAIGREQLRRAQALLQERTARAERYLGELSDCPGLGMPVSRPAHAWHLFVIHVDEARLGVTRDEFAGRLGERGISTSVHFRPLHTTSYYRDRRPVRRWVSALPHTERQAAGALSLPLYPTLSSDEQGYVIEQLRALVASLLT